MKNFYFTLSVLVLFSACKNTVKEISTPGQAKLTFASLYNVDSIRLVLNNASPSDSENANQTYLEGIDQLQNQNTAKSLEAFRLSLFTFPNGKTYYSLGNALILNGNYEDAIKAFHIAELMSYSPISDVMYKTAVVYSIMRNNKYCSDGITKYNDSLALHYMEIALQMGYSKPKDFLVTPAFDSLRINNEWQFKTIFQNANE